MGQAVRRTCVYSGGPTPVRLLKLSFFTERVIRSLHYSFDGTARLWCSQTGGRIAACFNVQWKIFAKWSTHQTESISFRWNSILQGKYSVGIQNRVDLSIDFWMDRISIPDAVPFPHAEISLLSSVITDDCDCGI